MTPYAVRDRRSPRRRGFTLVEVLIVMAVFGFVVAGTLGFFVSTLNLQKTTQGKLLVNRDLRVFTSELSAAATFANYFIVYDNFSSRNIVNDGLSGDFLVLVYRDSDEPERIERLVGFYRAVLEPGQEGPVQSFDLSFSPSSELPVEELLPAASAAGTHEIVIELSRGLSNGMLFYNFLDRSIMVRGEIIHRGAVGKRVTNTYNYTVSPRG